MQMCYLGWKWQGVSGKRLINNKVEEVEAVTDVDCMNLCVLHDVCESSNYRSSESSCELNTHPGSAAGAAAGPNPDDLVADNDWTHWNITSDLI